MLRIPSTKIPQEWIVRLQFSLWPPQRHRATLWLLARYVTFSMNRRHCQNLNNLMDFLRRSQWKVYQRPGRQRLVAHFLSNGRPGKICNERKKQHQEDSLIAMKMFYQLQSGEMKELTFSVYEVRCSNICV